MGDIDPLNDKEVYANILYAAEEPGLQLGLIACMGIGYRHVASALGADVTPETVKEWMNCESEPTEEHEYGIFTLKSTILFLLRRGILGPRQVGAWLIEPNLELEGVTPLATLANEGGVERVVMASRTFIRPEPQL